MPWPSDPTLHAALRTWLGLVHLEELWTSTGPTPRALELREQDGGPLAPKERVMLLAAFSLWKNREGLSLDFVHELGDRPLLAFCALFRACMVGDAAVEAWTAEWGGGGRVAVS